MSNYKFLPDPDIQGNEESYAWWDNGLSNDELETIKNYGGKQIALNATVGEDAYAPDVRRSKVSWIQHNQETAWLYDRLAYIARMVNGQYFQFDLHGFNEDFQYTVYEESNEGHYDWHIDRGYKKGNGSAPRKLSLVVQLSDPSEYEGGDLELQYGNGTRVVEKKKGLVHVFPSWVLHRVTPVTKGTRCSLVVWACGPKFR